MLLIVNILFWTAFVWAEELNPVKKLEEVAKDTYDTTASAEDTFPETLGIIVNAFLSLLGIIFIILMLYGGYNWMIARGEEEKVTTAKRTIQSAIIGLIIVVGSYAIWSFIFTYLIEG